MLIHPSSFSGSLFNHSSSPNVSYIIDTETESIRYTTIRAVTEGEELCIFYGHKLWFDAIDAGPNAVIDPDTLSDDGWGGLSMLDPDPDSLEEVVGRFIDGDLDDLIPEENLPFTHLKLVQDEEEEVMSAVRTGASFANPQS